MCLILIFNIFNNFIEYFNNNYQIYHFLQQHQKQSQQFDEVIFGNSITSSKSAMLFVLLLKESRSGTTNFFNEEQRANIFSILLTFPKLKLDKFKLVNDLQK